MEEDVQNENKDKREENEIREENINSLRPEYRMMAKDNKEESSSDKNKGKNEEEREEGSIKEKEKEKKIYKGKEREKHPSPFCKLVIPDDINIEPSCEEDYDSEDEEEISKLRQKYKGLN